MKISTPKYRIEASYVCFLSKCRTIATFAQDRVMSQKQLEKWRNGMNDSMLKGGANEHLAKNQSHYSTITLINQRTGMVVASYQPPAFEIVPKGRY